MRAQGGDEDGLKEPMPKDGTGSGRRWLQVPLVGNFPERTPVVEFVNLKMAGYGPVLCQATEFPRTALAGEVGVAILALRTLDPRPPSLKQRYPNPC